MGRTALRKYVLPRSVLNIKDEFPKRNLKGTRRTPYHETQDDLFSVRPNDYHLHWITNNTTFYMTTVIV